MLAAALALAPQTRPLDVVLRIDAPKEVRARPPLRVELTFVLENSPGLKTFSGQCPWEDPARPLVHRWKGGLVLDAAARGRTLKGVHYLIKDRDGRTVLNFLGADPAQKIHAEALSALVLHLTPGNLGEPGGAVDHQVELEF
jgi:hypothetical protein